MPPRFSSSSRWTLVLFVVAAAALIASVAMPASETGHVLTLLDEDETVIEPARRAASKIEVGIAEEASALQRYAIADDSASLQQLQTLIAQDDRNLRGLRELASHLDQSMSADVSALSQSIDGWRELERALVNGPHVGDAFVRGSSRRNDVRDSIVIGLSNVQSDLDERAASRRAAVRAHERSGLAQNAALVLVAFAAIVAVFETLRRDRRRAQRDLSLRLAAESLAGAFTFDDAAAHVARMAVALHQGGSAYVAHLESDAARVRHLMVRASSGADAPNAGTELPYAGTAAERAGQNAHPLVNGDTMIIPLGAAASPIGAVFVRTRPGQRFREDELTWAGIHGHLASLAYEKIRLLEEAREGRRRLEQVMDRRSRLMRGFSHDVKNPLGVADGYAALLVDGIYGPITVEQQHSVAHVRQAIHQALSLIEDVHELSRAETGNLAVHLGATDLGELVVALAEEYQAASAAKRLSLTVDIEPGLPIADTDPARIRQILGNLVSNAIKYTAHGSVTLRARGEENGGAADVVITVTDTGPGITPEWTTLVFEEFTRVAGTNQPGAGLGLAISKRVADVLGCALYVESEVGRGSTFVLRIPARAKTARADVTMAIPPAPGASLPPSLT